MNDQDFKKKYANRPNLLRVATELAKCKQPDRTFEIMCMALKGGIDDFTNSQKNLGLPIG